MMISFDIATVREFIICVWPQKRMERLFLQLIKKKLISLNKFLALSNHKTLNPLFLFPTKISEKVFHARMACLKSWSPRLYKWRVGMSGGGVDYENRRQLKRGYWFLSRDWVTFTICIGGWRKFHAQTVCLLLLFNYKKRIACERKALTFSRQKSLWKSVHWFSLQIDGLVSGRQGPPIVKSLL